MVEKSTKLMNPDALERQLQRDLEAIRKYREVVARYGGKAPNGTPRTLPVATRPVRDTDSLIGTLEANLSATWEPVAFYLRKARKVRSNTNRGAVRNTIERLVEAGAAERKGDKASGVKYRRKNA